VLVLSLVPSVVLSPVLVLVLVLSVSVPPPSSLQASAVESAKAVQTVLSTRMIAPI
jgi:hypothetical protein